MVRGHVLPIAILAGLLILTLACAVGTPTPTALPQTPTPTATRTPLPTITPLPTPTPPPGNAYVLENARATELLFFEGGAESPPYGERTYATRFNRARARYIYYEVSFEYPEPGERIDFALDSRWYDPGGNVFNENRMDAWFEPDWTSSVHSTGFGYDRPGQWKAGQYRVELFVGGQPVISGTFEIR
jgi:hypothetical protein